MSRKLMDNLDALEQKAVRISQIPDRKLRHKAGYMLERECRNLDDQHRIVGGLDYQAEVSLRAVLTILFDFILFDAIEDEDWMLTMPESAGDAKDAVKEVKKNAS